MKLLRTTTGPIRRAVASLKAWVRRRADQTRIQRTAPLSPEDRSDKRRRQHVLVDLIHERLPSSGVVIVEVGTRYGKTSAHILKYCPQVEALHAIDLQAPEPQLDRLKGVHRATFLQGYSHVMAERFKDGSVDLVFIDADHSLEAVRRDLAAWAPKVKKGGILAGHDYGSHLHVGVKTAVDDFFRGHVHPLNLDANKVWWTIV